MSSISPSRSRASGWVDPWIHSDLVGIPVTVAVTAVVLISVGLFLAVGNGAGLFVATHFFPLALLGLLVLLPLLGRPAEATDGITVDTAVASRRVLVLADARLGQPALVDQVSRLTGRGGASEAMIIVPVAAASRLRALADDVDGERQAAQDRVDTLVAALRLGGVEAAGRAHVARPAAALLDGLREFAPTEVVMLGSGGKAWKDANALARRIRAQLGLVVVELAPTRMIGAAAA